MRFFPGDLLHIYNRGNNKQQIFFSEDNYRFFTAKIEKYVKPCSDILAYCLMPNHFHILVHVNERSCLAKKVGGNESTELHDGFRLLQSSYAKAINKQFGRTGSLFQQNTNFKLLNSGQAGGAYHVTYAEICFHYIHQNPLKAGLINKPEDWQFSSFKEYLADSEGLCSREFAYRIFDIKSANFYEISTAALKPELLEKIF